MLRRVRFEACSEAAASSMSNPIDAQLLRASSTVLLNLVASVQEHVDGAGARVAAAAKQSGDSSSTVRTFMLDSGSQINLLTLETARDFFTEQRVSNLRVIGVSGASKAADLAGHLVLLIQAPDGSEHHLDLGVAHGMAGCPMNLLSVSLLIQMGAVLHFEKGNCFFRAKTNSEHIPIH